MDFFSDVAATTEQNPTLNGSCVGRFCLLIRHYYYYYANSAPAWLQATAPTSSAERRRTSHGAVAKRDQGQRRRRRRKHEDVGAGRRQQARCSVSAGQRVAGRRAADAGSAVVMATAAAADAHRRRLNKHLLHLQETGSGGFSSRVTSLAAARWKKNDNQLRQRGAELNRVSRTVDWNAESPLYDNPPPRVRSCLKLVVSLKLILIHVNLL